MKALTLTQPWASLVALGYKRIETRSWSTEYRGPIAIHAAKAFPPDCRRFAGTERAIGRIPDRLPIGAVIATARLARIVRTECISGLIPALERHLGNYERGRYAWFLEEIEALPEPIAARGALGLWNWNHEEAR